MKKTELIARETTNNITMFFPILFKSYFWVTDKYKNITNANPNKKKDILLVSIPSPIATPQKK